MMTTRVYRLFALATAWLGISQPGWSQGTIAYFQPATPVLLYSPGFDQFYPLDFDGDGNPDFTFGYSFIFLGVRSEGANRILILQDPPPNVGGPIAPLPAGFLIGAGSESGALSWSSGFGDDFEALANYYNGVASGPFAGQHAYMGVEFQSGDGTHYGWALLQISGDYAAIGAIESWAWDTRPGEPIVAGAIPEPSGWTLMIGGACLLTYLEYRNRRAKTVRASSHML